MTDGLLQRFRSAFPTAPLPPRPVTGHRCPECNDTDRLLGGRAWPEVAADFPYYCHDVFPLLTDEAKRYYLPAYMASALGPDDGLQGTSVEAALMGGRLPADRFSAGQRDAIVAWLDEYTGGEANWMGPEWFRPTPTD